MFILGYEAKTTFSLKSLITFSRSLAGIRSQAVVRDSEQPVAIYNKGNQILKSLSIYSQSLSTANLG